MNSMKSLSRALPPFTPMPPRACVRNSVRVVRLISSFGSIAELPKNQYVLQIAFDTDPEKAHKLIELANAGLNSLAENGPSADFLAKAKENFLKNIPENHISNSYWKGQLGDYYRYGKDFDTEYEKVVKALTAEKVQEFVKEVLSQENFIEFIMRPE